MSDVDERETLTVTFRLDYVFGRRVKDRHPVPHLGRIQATVRNAILNPGLLRKTGRAKTTGDSC